MPDYRPRVHCVLTVPILGSSSEKDRQARGTQTIDIPVRVNHITLERNDHLMADECTIIAEYQDLNLDPRFLKHCTAQVWIGDQGNSLLWTPTRDDYRFIGICIKANRKTSESGLVVELSLRDYTTLFLAQKPYPTSQAPTYNSSLREAWRRICDHTGYWDVDTGKIVSNVEALREQLVARGDVDLDAQIKAAVPERLAKYGKLTPKHGDSAWDVWQRCVMSLGLISYIDKDQCIVTTSTELFTATDAPVMLYGLNILECDESVDTQINNKGINLVSYDHTTGKTIEAFYPQPGDARINVKRSVARRKHFKPDDVQADQYETYEYNDIKDPKILLELARRAFEERGRQEIQGSLKTAEMVVVGNNGTRFDLLNLGAGECIKVSIDSASLELIKNLGPSEDRVQRLVDIGYDDSVATLLARNLDAMPNLEPVFHTKRVSVTLEDTGDAGNFEVTINYWNKIRLTGDTDDS